MTIINPIIAKLLAHIESECTAVNREARYDDMLDECYSFDSVGGPFACMSPSRVLKEVDPIGYRCGVNDYFGTDDSYIEVGSETYRKDDVDAARESFIEDLDDQISDLESQIEQLELDEDRDIADLASTQRQLADLQADKKAAEDYAL